MSPATRKIGYSSLPVIGAIAINILTDLPFVWTLFAVAALSLPAVVQAIRDFLNAGPTRRRVIRSLSRLENRGALTDLENSLPTLDSSFTAGRSDFMIALGWARFGHSNGISTVRIKIDDDPRIATTPSQRNVLEHGMGALNDVSEARQPWADSIDNFLSSGRTTFVPLRVMAGGCLIVLQEPASGNEYVCLIYKTGGADKGRLTITSGLSESVDEWLRPGIIGLREAIEEMCVIGVSGRPLRPKVVGASIHEEAIIEKEYEVFMQDLAISGSVPIGVDLNDVATTTSKLFRLGNDQLSVNYNGETKEERGLIVIDSRHSCIDLIRGLRLRIDGSVEEAVLVAGEREFKQDGTPVFLDTEIHIFDRQNVATLLRNEGAVPVASYSDGKKMESGLRLFGTDIQLTAPAKAALAAWLEISQVD